MTNKPGQSGPDDAVRRDEGRVRLEYARRSADPGMERYYARIDAALRRANLERRTRLLSELDRLGERARLRVLDVGCGFGGDLAFLAENGFKGSNLAGVDVIGERIARAKLSVPTADIQQANGATLPFKDRTFDAAIQATTLSSVVDPGVRSRLAAEMLRVTRVGGIVVSYDMAVVVSRNPHLVRIDRAELRRLFGSARLTKVSSITLMEPIASRGPERIAWLAAQIPIFRSHLLAVIRASDEGSTADSDASRPRPTALRDD